MFVHVLTNHSYQDDQYIRREATGLELLVDIYECMEAGLAAIAEHHHEHIHPLAEVLGGLACLLPNHEQTRLIAHCYLELVSTVLGREGKRREKGVKCWVNGGSGGREGGGREGERR